MRARLLLLPAFLLPALLGAQTPAVATPAKPAAKPATAAIAKPATAATAAAKPATATGAAKATTATGVRKPAAATAKPALKPMTDDDKAIYALGLNIYRSLGQFDLSPAELDLLKQALTDAAQKKPAGELETWGPLIDPLQRSRASRIAEKQKTASAEFLRKAAVEMGAAKTDSGLVYREVRAGSGESPKATDTVKVNYRGTLVDGTEFDSSYKRNEPATFPLNGVIKCWTEGVQKMKPGGKSLLVCPSDLAYGDSGRPGIPGGAALVFEIELLEVVAPAAAPPAAK
jgi:FKBP-type peptidyl-prolyl cis-trans isomerase FkpA